MVHYRHITRLCILIVLGISAFIAVRSFFIPPSFGLHGAYKYSYYRADSLQEQKDLPVIYQGTGKCAECHKLQYNRMIGGHARIACETCHGFQQSHSEDTKIRVPDELALELCLRCHKYLQGRPENLHQIKNFTLHVIWALKHGFMGSENLSDSHLNAFICRIIESSDFSRLYPVCVDCHNPHIPGNPKVIIPNILKISGGVNREH